MAFGSDKNRKTRQLDETLEKDPVGWLGPGIEVEGKLKFAGGMIRVNARYKGEIVGEGILVVDDQGELEAEIHARIISVGGKVKGAVHASERIEIKEHGVVLGDMYTPSLVIDPGGFFDGQCHMPTPEGLAKQHAEKPADQEPT